jgi:hypothetical protein
MFGIVNQFTQAKTVIYDEVDVFYEITKLDEFHRFFFSQIYNFTSKCVIFASATIDNNLLDLYDFNMN